MISNRDSNLSIIFKKSESMKIIYVIIAICSLFFFMIGTDKFFSFLDPACSLMDRIPFWIWKLLGVLQIVSGILIWWPKYRKYIAGFFLVLMIVFISAHLLNNTSDFGGAAVMAVLLGLVVWNPEFLGGRSTE